MELFLALLGCIAIIGVFGACLLALLWLKFSWEAENPELAARARAAREVERQREEDQRWKEREKREKQRAAARRKEAARRDAEYRRRAKPKKRAAKQWSREDYGDDPGCTSR